MSETSFLVSLPRKCVVKPANQSFLFDQTPQSLVWQFVKPGSALYDQQTSLVALDPVFHLYQVFDNLLYTENTIVVPTTNPELVYNSLQEYSSTKIALKSSNQIACIYGGVISLTPKFVEALEGFSNYCDVALTVTSDLKLSIYGEKTNVSFAEYKINIALQTFYGFTALKHELQQPLHQIVSGPCLQNIKTLYDQSKVNIYYPPRVCPKEKATNEIYFVGDEIQVILAEKLFVDAVIDKTTVIAREQAISAFVRDVLVQKCGQQIDDIAKTFAVSIKFPKCGQTADNNVLVFGSNKFSVNKAITQILRLCSEAFLLEVETKLDDAVVAGVASGSGCNAVLKQESSKSSLVFYGLRSEVHKALEILKPSNPYACFSVIIEQPVDLVEFILGKKQGKINKVVSGTGTVITTEKLHEHNFRLRLSGTNVHQFLNALTLLEDELPAEKSLYIPAIYHKQVIGQGGQTIQQLMRKYNVYMRFESNSNDQYPNIFGNFHADNVLVRCPTKNKSSIEGAISELKGFVDSLSKTCIRKVAKLSRNHRRILLGTFSSQLCQIENSCQVAICIPNPETRDTQDIEIYGQHQSHVTDACQMLGNYLPEFDQEFRIPWSQRFSDIVGPQSEFNKLVVAPLLLSLGAHTQTFDEVQMHNDSAFYSQIVVSTAEPLTPKDLQTVTGVITTYLRSHNMDIVDSGEVRTDILSAVVSVKSPKKVTTSSPVSAGQPAQPILQSLSHTQPALQPFMDPKSSTPLSLASLSRMNKNSILDPKPLRTHEDTPTRKMKPLTQNKKVEPNFKLSSKRPDFAKLR